jgi:predicted site-specific integrase-resolvase
MKYLTAEEFARARQPRPVPTDTVRRWCREGLIESVNDGGRVLIPESELTRQVTTRRRGKGAKAIRVVGKVEPAERDALVERIRAAVEELGLADRVSVEA